MAFSLPFWSKFDMIENDKVGKRQDIGGSMMRAADFTGEFY